jgi:NTP pyrophosphatase (non-canonical NTP hydrolase)|tara:strand:+ start:4339 stop:5157 length:819 start_codon:yes stop_codon:yes gene_type:complete
MLDTNKRYHLYHIPGKKIGVTCDLNNRVTKQQGYRKHEYEVIESSNDINYVSLREHQLQEEYGYKKDMRPYKEVIKSKIKIKSNKMSDKKVLSSSSATTTFPCPIVDLRSYLLDNENYEWEMPTGIKVSLSKDNIEWILKNANRSQFGDDKCYIYNKTFVDQMTNDINIDKLMQDRFFLIRSWAVEKGIYKGGDSKTQYIKLMEEAGELAKALLKRDEPEIIDAIGDMVIVLTNLAKLEGLDIEDCIDSAYNVVKNRQGKMINGTFVKIESL